MEGGPIALVQDGDTISLDIARRSLSLEVGDQELAARRARWQRPAPKAGGGYLAIYSRLASSASRGGILLAED
jgi:dihydroxy-acid dehydratase